MKKPCRSSNFGLLAVYPWLVELRATDCRVAFQVNMDKSLRVRLGANFKQTVLALVKFRQFVELRCFCKLSFSIICPSVVPASEQSGAPGSFVSDWKCAMATNVVERAQDRVLSQNQKDPEACKLKCDIIASLGETAPVADADPVLRSMLGMPSIRT